MFNSLSTPVDALVYSLVVFIIALPMYQRQLTSSWCIKEDHLREKVLASKAFQLALSAFGALMAVLGYWLLSLVVDGVYSAASLILSVAMLATVLSARALTEKAFYTICVVFSALFCALIVALDGSLLSYFFSLLSAAAVYIMLVKAKKA